ncbi:Chemotaxis regulator - transmits chemoreceptor signals to flagelllar motor components CheY [Paramagnetospirillum magnetotacticum MS-1]|uniref:Chemotaxis regulator-transmits chemoreceptor signals to flagelllar motor components CheY n=1 Tax=Paramagnetospirillum magnetotacticum MS-1 TaxID=272627 RepID=A0A0C2YLU7_PARME|nr:Chemotaxis regulator - transmits chemoreceptor signals to flagelllar motor components CheY [Paramagnetospirillum magnetotacticum MS-1]
MVDAAGSVGLIGSEDNMLKLTQDMMIGHPIIDADHKKLISIINQFLVTAKICETLEGEVDGQNEAAMHVTLKQLIAYTHEHFEREEKIQRECMYPYFEMHVREHRVLKTQLEEMASSYFIAKSRKVNRQSLNEMSEFLRMWLFNHIMKFDMNYRDWVCPKGN